MAVNASERRPAHQKVVKKVTTQTTKKHRFASFNQRISNLKINPIRKKEPKGLEKEAGDNQYPFFSSSLSRWSDRNLSADFSLFRQQVVPYCNSLSQVLYHKKTIFKLLIEHIDRRDVLSLEPLLDLLSNFAHDLGHRFEEYFSEAVGLITSVASTISSVEAIEWSFECLAWLFKYLARLLTPNLGPLVHLLAPFLGTKPQKTYTVRFAAEALAFLVRKCAVSHDRFMDPLIILLQSLVEELGVCRETEGKERTQQFTDGVVILLSESIKGTERIIHSRGDRVYAALLNQLWRQNGALRTEIAGILYGTTTALIHHTDVKGFEPILDAVLNRINRSQDAIDEDVGTIFSRLLFLIATVRHGSRIGKWQEVMNAMFKLFQQGDELHPLVMASHLKTLAVFFHRAPLEFALPSMQRILEVLRQPSREIFFSLFCNYCNSLSRERFHELLLPQFMNFFSARWQNYSLLLTLSLQDIITEEAPKKPRVPVGWLEAALDGFTRPLGTQDEILEAYTFLEGLPRLQYDADSLSKVFDAVRLQVMNCMTNPDLGTKSRLLMGSAFRTLVRTSSEHRQHFQASWPNICDNLPSFAALGSYLDGVQIVAGHLGEDWTPIFSISHAQPLLANLQMPSDELRLQSLRILRSVCSLNKLDGHELLTTACAIEETPRNLQTSRYISLQIRRISSEVSTIAPDPIICEAIVAFFFGVLTYKLSEARNDALEAMRALSKTAQGEHAISRVTFEWLDHPGKKTNLATMDGDSDNSPPNRIIGDDAHSEGKTIDELLDRKHADFMEAKNALERRFDNANSFAHLDLSERPRMALTVLEKLPQLAEKQSARFIPHFLSWALTTPKQDVHDDGQEDKLYFWKELDRKKILKILGSFDNPRRICKAEAVQECLKDLLCHGNEEIQKLALLALFSWKLPGIGKERESLLNLLDESKIRDQLTALTDKVKEHGHAEAGEERLFMSFVTRILYGRMVNRGKSSTGQSQASRRRSILNAISSFGRVSLIDFLDITLGDLRNIQILSSDQKDYNHFTANLIPPRKQYGLVNMIKSILEVLGNGIEEFAHDLMNAVLYCGISSIRWLSAESAAPMTDCSTYETETHKSTRQTSLQCLNRMIECFSPSSFQMYLPIIYSEILGPRLNNLAIESSQSVSSYLKMISLLASNIETLHNLAELDRSILGPVTDLLVSESCKDEVKIFAMDDILSRTLETLVIEEDDENIAEKESFRVQTLLPSSDRILRHLETFLQGSKQRDTLASGIALVSRMASLVGGSDASPGLLNVSIMLLNHPLHLVNVKSKGQVVQIIQHLVPGMTGKIDENLLSRLLHTLSPLLGYFKDRENRAYVCSALDSLGHTRHDLAPVATICKQLNTFLVNKLDKPDFDSRSSAFRELGGFALSHFTADQWRPILFNMLYDMKNEDEFMLRSNASSTVRKFIKESSHEGDLARKEAIGGLCGEVLLPALRQGASETAESVRHEFVQNMGVLVSANATWDKVEDLVPLLVNNDEEASFFSNILHIQQHRRMRAMRRLSAESRNHVLSSTNVANFLIPLLEHFIFNKAEGESAQNLNLESIKTIGVISSALEWSRYRGLLRKYIGFLASKTDVTKSVLSLIEALVSEIKDAARTSQLSQTIPKSNKFAEEVSQHILPIFFSYLRKKDETFVSLRVRVAVITTKILQLLPSDSLTTHLPPLLTDICSILRSRADESRDMARRALARIAELVGPEYFGFLLKELRTALTRGYQLHVLGFTLHTLFIETTNTFQSGSLDYCTADAAAIMNGDIFGSTGQEKDAEDYISKMREVKSNKSFDSYEHMARLTSLSHVIDLLRPLKSLLEGTLDIKTSRKADEVLRRIGLGLMRNDDVQGHQALVFCYELMREGYGLPTSQLHQDAISNHSVNGTMAISAQSNQTGANTVNAQYSQKVVRFALDLLRNVLQKNDDLKTPSNLSQFIPMIGDALMQPSEQVQISALRILTTSAKVPLEILDENADAYIAECVKIIKNSTSTNGELPQTAIKLVSSILRERRDTSIRDADLAYLLKRLKSDLEEPSHQGSAFNFVRALLTRKVMLPELYDVMDFVASIMVTSQAKNSRDMARATFFQFFTEYPQTGDRFFKQIAFLAGNLDYKYVEGRKSVMEMLHLLFTKIRGETLQKLLESFVVPLVMVLLNDDSNHCREISSVLLKTIFDHADAERTKHFLHIIKGWLDQEEDSLLNRAAFQVTGILFDSQVSVPGEQYQDFRRRLSHLLIRNCKEQAEPDWKLIYQLLQSFSKICSKDRQIALSSSCSEIWECVEDYLDFDHGWVKLSAARLLGTLFADFAKHNAKSDNLEMPLEGSHGLRLSAEAIIRSTEKSLKQLTLPGVQEDLASQSSRNLAFLGRIMTQSSLRWAPEEPSYGEEDEPELDGSDWNGFAEWDTSEDGPPLAVMRLLSELCKILRRPPATTRAPSLIPLRFAVQLLTVLTTHLPSELLVSELASILRPLYNLTDTSIPAPFSTDNDFNEGYSALKSNASELMSSVQSKIGSSDYIDAMQTVRQGAKKRREQRQSKRAFERVAEPEKAEKGKRKKIERKKDKRQERSREERGKRRGW